MRIFPVTAVAAVTLISSAVLSQGAPPQGSMPGASNNPMQTGMNQETFNRMQDYADQAKRLTREDKAAGKTLDEVLAEDKIAATTLVRSMPLSCEVTAAMRIASGPETVEGRTVQTQTYEAACANGMGYFLISQSPASPYGFSCFAVDATAKADIAAGHMPKAICQLPSNADMKATATKVLSGAGYACKVKDYRWAGQNSSQHIEFDEVACDDGRGYILLVALPGAQIPAIVKTCNQSARQGLPCKLSDNGDVGPTLASFRAELTRAKVACNATDQTTRVIGQIATKKVYVVEFACPQQPRGLVAYIPQSDSKALFEVVDCNAAAKRGAICGLAGNKK